MISVIQVPDEKSRHCDFYISPAIKLWSGSTKETFIEKGPTLSLKSCSCPSGALVPISSMIIFRGLHMGSYSVCRFLH